jgi:4-alpha-glucanotransferase
MEYPRAAGILLHPTSLPGRFGIGDLGPAAFEFIDQLADAGQTYWQMLPLGPTGYGDSPYQSFSAFAGSLLLISPEKLADDGLISPQIVDQMSLPEAGRVDYGAVFERKSSMLPAAFESFRKAGGLPDEFERFAEENANWLDDFALYRAVKASQGQKPWFEWDEKLKLRDAAALADTARSLGAEIETEKFFQFLFFRQWNAVREYANRKGIKVIGDLPIFVALDSADVWRHQSQFKLNADGTPKVVSGVPPDYFSKTGQLWGNPIYEWDAMKRDGFTWWADRFRSALRMFDIVRIDHFRGFAACWEVPGEDKTAEHGTWVEAPGRELFAAVKNAVGELPFIAEDLGVITPDVTALRDEFGFPGMRILQYAFGGGPDNQDLPHNYIRNCVAYTGTHDNDTALGWYKARAGAEENHELKHCLDYLNSDGEEFNWDFIRGVLASVADTAIVPMQDVLGLDNDSRMNLPASTSGNWNWRMLEGAFSGDVIQRLAAMTELYGRGR